MAAERRKRLLNAALDAEEFTRLGQDLVCIPSLLDFARVRKSSFFRLSVAWLQDIRSCNGVELVGCANALAGSTAIQRAGH